LITTTENKWSFSFIKEFAITMESFPKLITTTEYKWSFSFIKEFAFTMRSFSKFISTTAEYKWPFSAVDTNSENDQSMLVNFSMKENDHLYSVVDIKDINLGNDSMVTMISPLKENDHLYSVVDIKEKGLFVSFNSWALLNRFSKL
jgi:hypothetical protein